MLLNSGTLSRGRLVHAAPLPRRGTVGAHTPSPEAPPRPHALGARRTCNRKRNLAVHVSAVCFSREQRVLLILVSPSEGLSVRAVLSPHPQETLGNVWTHAGCHNLGGGALGT